MNPSDIELVCFDLGGVLLHICPGWKEACAAAGVAEPAELKDRALWPEIQDVGVRYEKGELDDEEFAARVSGIVSLTREEVFAVCDAWLKGPYAGAVELIEEVAGLEGVRSACLSNTNARHWRAMNTPGRVHLGLERLDHRFTSFLIGEMKPTEMVYQHVEEATGVNPPAGGGEDSGLRGGGILFFDDSPANVEAARGRGWLAELIDPAADPVGQVRGHLMRYDVM